MWSDAGLVMMIWATVEGEVARLRGPGGLPMPELAFTDRAGATLDEIGLGIGSLEQMGVQLALSELFGIESTLPSRRSGRAASVGEWADLIVRRWRDAEPALWMRSSGTTGTPKLHRHRLDDLVAEAKYFADLIGPRRRVLALVPGHHIYGLIWTVLLPELLQVPVARVTGDAGKRMTPGDLVVGTAEHWRTILHSSAEVPEEVIGVNAAAPLSAEETQSLLAAGLERVIDVYGSTETGGIGAREAPASEYRLLPRWTFVPPAEAVGNNRDRIRSKDGVVIDLPDNVAVGSDGFTLGARRDGIVQVGGHNVDPTIVAGFMRAHALVADAAVRLGSNGRLKAFLVPSGEANTEALIADVALELAARLPAYARPVAYRVGAQMPLGILGKPGDWD
jgi:4-coumarate--CoA ligase (photoactive yellow protein activation family)